MFNDLHTLTEIFIPFSLILMVLSLIYITLNKIKQRPLKASLKENMTQILSIISTLLVFVTLLEMRTERIQAYKPFIVLGSGTGGCTYTLAKSDISDHQFAVFSTNYSDMGLSGDVKIPIKNIGVGVANKLKMVFSIDFSANTYAYFLFEDVYPSDLTAYRDYNEIGIVVDRSYMSTNTFLNAPDIDILDEGVFYQSFILPNNQETLYVKLPVEYLSAIRKYMAYCLEIDVPPLYLTVEYEDVQGITYSQKFYLALSAEYWFNNKDGNYTLYYTFTPEENVHIKYKELPSTFPEAYDYSKNLYTHVSKAYYNGRLQTETSLIFRMTSE